MGLTNPIFLCKVFSDRVADTCVACDQGGSCGNSFFYIRRTLAWPEFHGIPPDCRQKPYKKLPERHGSNNVEHRQTLVVIPGSVTSIGEYAFVGCSSLTIHCAAEKQPEGWDYFWNPSHCPVVWGYKSKP